jgi:pimeloyl-ACP methyl ester carboxylesterase
MPSLLTSLSPKTCRQLPTPSTMSKPTIVFVPGAWHTSAAFNAVIALLKTHDYESIGLHLPSVGGNPVVTDMDPDKALIRSTATKLVEAGKDVLVVSHSYGGVPANSSLEGLSKTERANAGKKGGVIGMAMIAAFLLDAGRSLLNGGRPAEWTSKQVSLVQSNPFKLITYITFLHVNNSDHPDPLRGRHSLPTTLRIPSTTTSPPPTQHTGNRSCFRRLAPRSMRRSRMRRGRLSQRITCCVNWTMRFRWQCSGACARMRLERGRTCEWRTWRRGIRRF